MTVWIDFFCLLILGAVIMWLPSAGLAELASRWLLSPRTSPGIRTSRLWLLAATPWLAMAAPLIAMCLVAAAKPLGWVADHCHLHAAHHPHLCFEHWPAVEWQQIHLWAAIALAALVVRTLAGFCRRERKAARQVAALRRFSRGRGRLRRLDTPASFACSAGVRQPSLFITRGLEEQLNARERRIVLAHEVAHLRHRDLLRSLVFDVLLLLHLPATARRLREHWRQTIEEQADDRVARRFGAEAVAATLIRVLRVSRPAPPGSLSATGGQALARIRRLLQPPVTATALRWPGHVIATALFLGLIYTVISAHHSIETLLGFLAGA